MRKATALLIAASLSTQVGCASGDDHDGAAPSSTTMTSIGDDRIPAPDLGCNMTAAGRAPDYIGGTATIEGAAAVFLGDDDFEVISSNQKYAWVVAPARAPTERNLFFDGGSGWAFSLTGRCFESQNGT